MTPADKQLWKLATSNWITDNSYQLTITPLQAVKLIAWVDEDKTCGRSVRVFKLLRSKTGELMAAKVAGAGWVAMRMMYNELFTVNQ